MAPYEWLSLMILWGKWNIAKRSGKIHLLLKIKQTSLMFLYMHATSDLKKSILFAIFQSFWAYLLWAISSTFSFSRSRCAIMKEKRLKQSFGYRFWHQRQIMQSFMQVRRNRKFSTKLNEQAFNRTVHGHQVRFGGLTICAMTKSLTACLFLAASAFRCSSRIFLLLLCRANNVQQ